MQLKTIFIISAIALCSVSVTSTPCQPIEIAIRSSGCSTDDETIDAPCAIDFVSRLIIHLSKLVGCPGCSTTTTTPDPNTTTTAPDPTPTPDPTTTTTTPDPTTTTGTTTPDPTTTTPDPTTTTPDPTTTTPDPTTTTRTTTPDPTTTTRTTTPDPTSTTRTTTPDPTTTTRTTTPDPTTTTPDPTTTTPDPTTTTMRPTPDICARAVGSSTGECSFTSVHAMTTFNKKNYCKDYEQVSLPISQCPNACQCIRPTAIQS